MSKAPPSIADPELPRRFADALGQLTGPDFPNDLALAVSGGSDSMAMLLLAHGWARHMGVRLWVVTVDHGLREGSAAEAKFVASECQALGLDHTTLTWRGWDGTGNMQAAARAARYRLIDQWRGQIAHVLVAHTADDVAETFVMRLARGSGVDGLAAMQGRRGMSGGYTVIRPLLGERRDTLQNFLRFYQTKWCEDPSNHDPAYDRVKVRQALPALADLGLDVRKIVQTAQRMQRAREGLEARAFEAASTIVETEALTGDVIFDRDGLAALDRETALRLLAEGLRVISSQPYRPRSAALEDALDRTVSGGKVTLHGCLVHAQKDVLRVTREYNAVSDCATLAEDGLWDQRWRPSGDALDGLTIRALGPEGAAQITRPDGVPFTTLITMPALYEGEKLVGCAIAGHGIAHRMTAKPRHGAFAAHWQPLKRRT